MLTVNIWLVQMNKQTSVKHMAVTYLNTEVTKATVEVVPPQVRFQNDLRLVPLCSGDLGLEHSVIPALQTCLHCALCVLCG